MLSQQQINMGCLLGRHVFFKFHQGWQHGEVRSFESLFFRDQNGYLDAYVVKFGRTLTGIKFDSTRMIAGNAPFQHDDEVIVSSWCLLSKG